jgi:N-acetylglucosaminyldiphosphoundecaprenol N-acetyl-beta-D-mannosaminyltransferase
MNNIRILRGRVDTLTFSQAMDAVHSLRRAGGSHQVVTANTLMLLACETDPSLRRILDQASLVIPESWGVAWASRHLKRPLAEYIPGIDFMTALCAQAERDGDSIFLLGGRPGVADAAAAALQQRHPDLRIAGTHDGYFGTQVERVIQTIRAAKPTYLFVGLNVPEQEKWIATHREALGVPVQMGVGGSFDVISGALRRAPEWMRQMGLEWVFRTVQEPWRMKRIKNLPVFMWRVALSRSAGAN